MANLIIYKSALEEEVLLEKETTEPTLSKTLYECKELHGQYVVAYVNKTLVPVDDWHLFELLPADKIQVISEIEKGALKVIGAAVGAIIGAYGGPWGAAKGAMIGYSLGSYADSLLADQPVMPLIPVKDSDLGPPDYGWEGAKLGLSPDGPVYVIYGQYQTGGVLINQYISSEKTFTELGDELSENNTAVSDSQIEAYSRGLWNPVIVTMASQIEIVSYEDYRGPFGPFRKRIAYKGNFCFKVTASSPPNQEFGITNFGNDFPVTIGLSYEIRCKIKTIQGITTAWKLRWNYTFFDYFDLPPIYISSNSWQELKWIVSPPVWAGVSASIDIFTTNQSLTTAYFDDISIREIGGIIQVKDSYLNMLINYGEGEIEGIMNSDLDAIAASPDIPSIEINGQPYENYYDITWEDKKGTNTQFSIPGFHNLTNYYPDKRKVTYSSPITYTTEETDLEEFSVLLITPAIYKINDRGEEQTNTIKYDLHYRIVGGSWVWAGDQSYEITDVSRTTCYYLHTVKDLTANQYEIRITRLTPEFTSFKQAGDLYLSGVNETKYENIAYRNSALLALKIKATDQLSGSTPNVTSIIRGRTVTVPKLTIGGSTQTYEDCYWDDDASTYKRISDNVVCTDTGGWTTDEQWTRNPIWCTRDFVLKKRYGLGEYYGDAQFDDTAARTEAKYCWMLVDDLNGGTEHRFRTNISISQFMSAPTALQMLARTFRGWIIWSNGMLKPVIDRDRDPVQLFNASNIIPRSLKTTYLPASKIPNFCELQYADPDRNYNLHTVEVVDQDEWSDIKPLRKQTVSCKGITDIGQVLRDGKYFLNCAKYCTKIIEYKAEMDAIHCEPGDAILFQSDSHSWGVGGRIVAATSNSITTNIDVIVGASTYYVRVRLPDGSLELKQVTNVAGTYRVLTISGTFTDTPLVDSIFTFGETAVDAKPFKVLNMKRLEKNDCQIIAIEESVNKYNDTEGVYLPEPDYSDLPNPAEAPPSVTDLALNEMTSRPGFWISFNIPQENIAFHHADVHMSMDNISWFVYRSDIRTNAEIEVLNTRPGQTYYVKIISYNGVGVPNLSPVFASIKITDVTFTPPNVNGLRLDGETTINVWTGKEPKFTWLRGSVVSGAGREGAGQELLGAGQYVEELWYKYWVEIWVDDVKTRKEILSDNFYVYTWEKNLLDNTVASRSIVIKVWGYNEAANKKSNNPAVLTVSNPAPDMTNLYPDIINNYTSLVIDWSDIVPADIDLDKFVIYGDKNNPPTTQIASFGKNTKFFYWQNLDAQDTYYVQIEPYDVFGAGLKSAVESGIPLLLIADQIDMELVQNIIMSDSDDNNATDLAKLYDKIKLTGGVQYTVSGTDKYIQYAFPVQYIVDRISVWANGSAQVYIVYSADGTNWSYLKAETDHTLNEDGELLTASSQETAQYAYWSISSGANVGIFPRGVAAKYFRLYLTGSYTVTVYELIFTREIVAEMIAARTITGEKIALTSYVAINNDIFGFNGIQLQYNSGDPRFYCGDGANQYLKFDETNLSWKGTNTELTAAGAFTATSATIKGLVEIIGAPALQNMLMNGGFEETDGTNAYYWTSGTKFETVTTGGDGSNKYLKVTSVAGEEVSCDYIHASGNIWYFEVNTGETYEYGYSGKSSNGSIRHAVYLQAHDKDKNIVSQVSVVGYETTWTSKSSTYTVASGVKFLSFFCHVFIVAGWGAFDNVYLKRVDEKAWSFTHASDRTKIDGGNIYTNTLTATHINGAGFGTLTITSGKLAINTTDALEIQAAGNIKVLAGGDIVMTASDTNPSLIKFTPSAGNLYIGAGNTIQELCLYPETAGTGKLSFGFDTSDNVKAFDSIFGKVDNFIKLEVNRSTPTRITHLNLDYDYARLYHYNGSYSQCDVKVDGVNNRITLNTSSGGLVRPGSAADSNLGDASYYWNDVSYKTLSDRGCLGWFDSGVEMPDGSLVSDLEALKLIQKDTRPGKDTVYGVPMLDYRTMPKAVYKQADDKDGLLPRDENDEPYNFEYEKDEEGNELETKKKIFAADGAEMSALISIMLGAIKELDTKLEVLAK